ncbi:MAG: hypothetical protein JRG86_06850 [Deltaproteobacteria bacterium]|jgi:steroid delta-isomerase|nr:hypothetical protein [Deltaproteobacteria bacterium]MBW2495895.1 hypothetical protein [Deltaproteobacteria bacterium]
MSIYADDCWSEDLVGSERKVGREAIREFDKLGIDMGAHMSLESEIRIAGNEAAFAFRLEANTPQGKLSVRRMYVMGFDGEGRVISMRAFFGPINQGIES